MPGYAVTSSRIRIAFTAAALLVTLAAAPSPAGAAFPGANGKIAVDGIVTVNPDGSGFVHLTPQTGEDRGPAWSPDGQKIAFASDRDGNWEIYVMNADGTGQQRLTSHPFTDAAPEWSPDGAKIVFSSNRVESWELWVMNADGSGQTRLTDTADWAWATNGAWSPDGSRIAYTSDTDTYTIRPDGTGATLVQANAMEADWSPDGRELWSRIETSDTKTGDSVSDLQSLNLASGDYRRYQPHAHAWTPAVSPDGSKVVFHGWCCGAYVMTRDGAVQPLVDPGVTPDWQPLPVNTPSSHVRPVGATPFRVSLVPALNPCSAPNRQHGPPLAFPSCAPPQPGSPNLTVGVGDGHPALSRSVGFVRIAVWPGAPGGVDDTDARVQFSLTNVMRGSDLSEYTGELRASAQVRLTDRQGTVSQTTSFPLQFDVPCVPTAATLDKSTCNLVSTLDSVLPGAAAEGTRAVWALDQVRVYDGGPDEDADTTADNSLFAVQGVFVP